MGASFLLDSDDVAHISIAINTPSVFWDGSGGKSLKLGLE